MKLTKAYLLKLIRSGKAELTGYTTDSRGIRYGIVTRYDNQRTDHFID